MIPQAILPYVFQQLTYKELLQCSLVCKLWYNLMFDPLLGKQWKTIDFQQKVQKLKKKYVMESTPVISRLKNEEKMNWSSIFEKVLKRGRNHINYLKLWSSFNAQQMTMIIHTHYLSHSLILLDLRGTKFDVTFLFTEMDAQKNETNLKQLTHTKVKPSESSNKLNQHHKFLAGIKEKESKCDGKTSHLRESQKDDESVKEKGTECPSVSDPLEKEDTKDATRDTDVAGKEKEKGESSRKKSYFLDFFKNLKYLYIGGCKKADKDTVIKIHQRWKELTLDLRVCDECQEVTRICRDKALRCKIQEIEKLSHCSVCRQPHCDRCRPLWTCEICGGDYTCRDCRAHGLTCTTCDSDYCYTCNAPKSVLECRYCHRVSCGQSALCQNLAYLYRSCDKCHFYVCRPCQGDQESLVVCSGQNCTKSYCKTCIHELSDTALVSFDKKEVEKRIYENNFGVCSYCNKLFCMDCLDNLSMYVGIKEMSYAIILCKECESFYRHQLLHLFRMSQLRINPADYSNHSGHPSDRVHHPVHLLSITPSNLLTTRKLSLDSPIDIFNSDQYIR